MPKVTVMIPAYNAGKYIRDALESVLRQDYRDWEAIVVDDCSTDNTYGIASEFKKDLRVRLYRNRKKLGDYKTRNRMLRLARGKYIAPHDADDVMLQGRIGQHVAFLEKHRKIGVVFGSFLEADEKLTRLLDSTNIEDGGRSGKVARLPDSLSHCAATIRKKDMLRIGGYDSVLPHGEDTKMLEKLFVSTRFYYLNRPCLIYRIHPRSKTSRFISIGKKENIKLFNEKRKGKKAFTAIIGHRKAEVYRVTQKAVTSFKWRLRYYSQYETVKSAHGAVDCVLRWPLPGKASSAHSDDELFREGFLRPFADKLKQHNQFPVKAALVSSKGEGVLIFFSKKSILGLIVFLLTFRYRYAYHSLSAPILFFKRGVVCGDSFFDPIILPSGCKEARTRFGRWLSWNPLSKRFYIDMALVFAGRRGQHARITTIVCLKKSGSIKKPVAETMDLKTCYRYLTANAYSAAEPRYHESQKIFLKLAHQAKSFLVRFSSEQLDLLPDRLAQLILKLNPRGTE